MLLLLLAVYACILLSESFPKGSDTRALPKTWHFMLGLKVFELIWFRLIAKLVNSTPLIEPPIARWQDLTAKAVRALISARGPSAVCPPVCKPWSTTR